MSTSSAFSKAANLVRCSRYISCHGLLSPNRRLYFAATNTRRELLRTSAIPDSLVADVMQHTRAGRVILILDCCHSGAFGRGLATKGGTGVGIEHRFDQGRGRATLTASDELEYAFEADGRPDLGTDHRSVFTDALVTGLKRTRRSQWRRPRVIRRTVRTYCVTRSENTRFEPDAGNVRRLPRRHLCRPIAPTFADGRWGGAAGGSCTPPRTSRFAGVREGAVRELDLLAARDERLGEAARTALRTLADDDSKAVSSAAAKALRPGSKSETSRPAASSERGQWSVTVLKESRREILIRLHLLNDDHDIGVKVGLREHSG